MFVSIIVFSLSNVVHGLILNLLYVEYFSGAILWDFHERLFKHSYDCIGCQFLSILRVGLLLNYYFPSFYLRFNRKPVLCISSGELF